MAPPRYRIAPLSLLPGKIRGHRRETGIHVIFSYFLVDQAGFNLRNEAILDSLREIRAGLNQEFLGIRCNNLSNFNSLKLDCTPLHSKSRADIQNVQLTS